MKAIPGSEAAAPHPLHWLRVGLTVLVCRLAWAGLLRTKARQACSRSLPLCGAADEAGSVACRARASAVAIRGMSLHEIGDGFEQQIDILVAREPVVALLDEDRLHVA